MPTSSHRVAASNSRAQLAKFFSILGEPGAQPRRISREQVRRLKASLAERVLPATLNRTPLFFAETNILWCYAASLCVQLRTTNLELLEALKYSSRSLRPRPAVLARKGAVDVSFDPHGGEKLPTRLRPSSIFGQLALIDGGNGNGTCTVQQDTLLLEMKHDACHQLPTRHSPLAYKFLAAGSFADWTVTVWERNDEQTKSP